MHAIKQGLLTLSQFVSTECNKCRQMRKSDMAELHVPTYAQCCAYELIVWVCMRRFM